MAGIHGLHLRRESLVQVPIYCNLVLRIETVLTGALQCNLPGTQHLLKGYPRGSQQKHQILLHLCQRLTHSDSPDVSNKETQFLELYVAAPSPFHPHQELQQIQIATVCPQEDRIGHIQLVCGDYTESGNQSGKKGRTLLPVCSQAPTTEIRDASLLLEDASSS